MSSRPRPSQPPQVQPFDVGAAYAAFDAGIDMVVTDAETRRRAVKRGPQSDEDRRRSLRLDQPTQQEGQPPQRRSYQDLSDDELQTTIAKAQQLEQNAQAELDNRMYAEALTDADAHEAREQENADALVDADLEFYEQAGSGAITEPDGYVE